MDWTVERITEECRSISNRVGDNFDCPVAINSRLSTTLGRVRNIRNGTKYSPLRLEMSKNFLETATDECVKSVIAHEWAHYYTTKSTGEHHGHDKMFKATCARIGCTNDKTKTNVERIQEVTVQYKYVIRCGSCDSEIGWYKRRCATTQAVAAGNCTCGKCGSSNLELIQNW